MSSSPLLNLESPTHARLGTTLNGKWRLDAVLGRGGMATVYAATHRNGKRVAIKILDAQLRTNPELLARFMREGYVANKVGHPGAVSVIDDDTAEDGSAYMVMELLEGTSLDDLRRSRGGTLVLGEVLAITDAILDVLAAAHTQGIIHRDIKPENIFVLNDGQIRVLDFGIARLREQLGSDTKATQSGLAMGTPGFMSLEQARGRWELVDARSDLWAVGATTFTLLAGRCVHETSTVNETLLLAMTRPAEPVQTLLPWLPKPIAEWLDTALTFEKDARWADAATMQREGREARRRAEATVPRTAPSASGPSSSPPGVFWTQFPTTPTGTVALSAPVVGSTSLETGRARGGPTPHPVPAPEAPRRSRMFALGGAFLATAIVAGTLAQAWPAKDARPASAVAASPLPDNSPAPTAPATAAAPPALTTAPAEPVMAPLEPVSNRTVPTAKPTGAASVPASHAPNPLGSKPLSRPKGQTDASSGSGFDPLNDRR